MDKNKIRLKSNVMILYANFILLETILVNYLTLIIDRLRMKIKIQFIQNALYKFRNKLVLNNINMVDSWIIAGLAFIMLIKFKYFIVLAFLVKYFAKILNLYKTGKKLTTELVNYTVVLSLIYAIMWQFQPNVIMTLVMTWLFMSY